MLSGLMPPTGSTIVPGGSTARHALMICGGTASAGKSLIASAPALRAAKASVGVATPGVHIKRSSLARRITATSACGMTIRLPPTSRTPLTLSGSRTVPAPMSTESGISRARISMLLKGSGEFSGTSMMRNPASTRRIPTLLASSGRRPLRMATRGRSVRYSRSTSILPRRSRSGSRELILGRRPIRFNHREGRAHTSSPLIVPSAKLETRAMPVVPSGEPYVRRDMKPPPRTARVVLDRIDLSILEALRENGRLTYQALSERVGLSPRPCLERVKRLEQKGVIRGYAALIEPLSVGHDIIALAGITMRDPSAAARQRLERALCAHPSVVELQVVNGENDYVARFVAPTLASYEALTEAFLADPGFGIGRIHTTFVLKTLKSFDSYPVRDSQD